MSAPTVVRDLVVAHTRVLKLPGVARTFEGLARQARDSHWPHEDYLHEVLSAEQASRHESVIRQRLREARFPEVKTLDTFDFAAADGVNATQIHTLARGEWVTAPENLILAGPIGTGKTHLAIALGVEATKQKRRVLFTRAADLVRQLLEARDARELTRLQQRLLRVDVLIVDELGFVPVRPRRRRAALQSAHRPLRATGDRRHHAISPSPNGSPSLPATKSSPPRCSIAWRITPRCSRPKARAIACGSAAAASRPNDPSTRLAHVDACTAAGRCGRSPAKAGSRCL